MRLTASLGFGHSLGLRQLKWTQAQGRQQSVCLESLEHPLKKDRHKQNQTAQTKINTEALNVHKLSHFLEYQKHLGKYDLIRWTNKALETNPKMMEMCNLSDKELKMAVSRKLNKLQEKTESHLEIYREIEQRG